jgi:hypothetical protein
MRKNISRFTQTPPSEEQLGFHVAHGMTRSEVSIPPSMPFQQADPERLYALADSMKQWMPMDALPLTLRSFSHVLSDQLKREVLAGLAEKLGSKHPNVAAMRELVLDGVKLDGPSIQRRKADLVFALRPLVSHKSSAPQYEIERAVENGVGAAPKPVPTREVVEAILKSLSDKLYDNARDAARAKIAEVLLKP